MQSSTGFGFPHLSLALATPVTSPPGAHSLLSTLHSVSEMSVQRTSWGNGVAYHILADGYWIGTLSGAEGCAFRDQLVALPPQGTHDFLMRIATEMAAGLIGIAAPHTLTGGAL